MYLALVCLCAFLSMIFFFSAGAGFVSICQSLDCLQVRRPFGVCASEFGLVDYRETIKRGVKHDAIVMTALLVSGCAFLVASIILSAVFLH